jgi:hypothetical protein
MLEPAAAWYFASYVGSFSPGGRKRTYIKKKSTMLPQAKAALLAA